VLRGMETSLSESERIRAAKFLREEDRARYVFSKGRLREILARYLDARAEEIAFCANEFGKPRLDAPFHSSGICFNVSHSKDLVVIAVACDRQVGVDVEFVRTIVDFESIAHRWFTDSEREFVMSEQDSLNGFFRCWTRKEAFVKAIGKGLSAPLNSIDVSLPRGSTSGRIHAIDEGSEKIWWLTDVNAPEGYRCALVIEGDEPSLIYREWPECSRVY
jgi:4'-phosphopantetheinyl transferase